MAEGAVLLRGFARPREGDVIAALRAIEAQAPFRHMHTPGGHQMSVAMTNCGGLGWVTDRSGYRYDAVDPESGKAWPAMPPAFWLGARDLPLVVAGRDLPSLRSSFPTSEFPRSPQASAARGTSMTPPYCGRRLLTRPPRRGRTSGRPCWRRWGCSHVAHQTVTWGKCPASRDRRLGSRPVTRNGRQSSPGSPEESECRRLRIHCSRRLRRP